MPNSLPLVARPLRNEGKKKKKVLLWRRLTTTFKGKPTGLKKTGKNAMLRRTGPVCNSASEAKGRRSEMQRERAQMSAAKEIRNGNWTGVEIHRRLTRLDETTTKEKSQGANVADAGCRYSRQSRVYRKKTNNPNKTNSSVDHQTFPILWET